MTSSDGFFAIPIRGVEGRLVVDDTDVTVPDLDRFGGILGHGRVESEVVRASQLAERSRVFDKWGRNEEKQFVSTEIQIKGNVPPLPHSRRRLDRTVQREKKRNCKLDDNRKSRAQSLRLFHIGSVQEI